MKQLLAALQMDSPMLTVALIRGAMLCSDLRATVPRRTLRCIFCLSMTGVLRVARLTTFLVVVADTSRFVFPPVLFRAVCFVRAIWSTRQQSR